MKKSGASARSATPLIATAERKSASRYNPRVSTGVATGGALLNSAWLQIVEQPLHGTCLTWQLTTLRRLARGFS